MHLSTLLPVLLASSTAASLMPPSPLITASIAKRNVWDDVVHGVESLYSEAMATSTTIEPSPSPAGTAAVQEGTEDKKDTNSTEVKGSKCFGCFTGGANWSKHNGGGILERPRLLALAGVGLLVFGLFA
ncbi:hypothetical protein B0T20DRAFT_481618 [Sordaria brevicollis]|uniref:Uncharacterized protein n=1 Tax=Sordaria brevicollis TaxID=83679 RepID=A0AAE0PB34_SORBR|nr:hypothetical protein B0T20DRAFT_481618 [Sordaria brevicollis]